MPVIVVPAFNEEANVPNLMRDLAERPELWRDGTIILVDDGSSDRTVEVAKAAQAAGCRSRCSSRSPTRARAARSTPASAARWRSRARTS